MGEVSKNLNSECRGLLSQLIFIILYCFFSKFQQLSLSSTTIIKLSQTQNLFLTGTSASREWKYIHVISSHLLSSKMFGIIIHFSTSEYQFLYSIHIKIITFPTVYASAYHLIIVRTKITYHICQR